MIAHDTQHHRNARTRSAAVTAQCEASRSAAATRSLYQFVILLAVAAVLVTAFAVR